MLSYSVKLVITVFKECLTKSKMVKPSYSSLPLSVFTVARKSIDPDVSTIQHMSKGVRVYYLDEGIIETFTYP